MICPRHISPPLLHAESFIVPPTALHSDVIVVMHSASVPVAKAITGMTWQEAKPSVSRWVEGGARAVWLGSGCPGMLRTQEEVEASRWTPRTQRAA